MLSGSFSKASIFYSYCPDRSSLQIVHPNILDESISTQSNISTLPTVINIGGNRFDAINSNIPEKQGEWTKVTFWSIVAKIPFM